MVATPIGNLGDLSPRAVEVLATADDVACEDSRVTGRLLAAAGVNRKLRTYHDHNAERERPKLLVLLREGQSVALVSDAGTPLVSDPGYKLVRAAAEAGHPVFAVPGPSAVGAALSVAGLPTDRFLFLGFLPPRQRARRTTLAEIAPLRATLVLFETGPRLAGCLADLADVLGAREAVVLRELTKLYEEARRGDLPGLAAAYAAEGPPKGEIVIVIGPPIGQVPGAVDVDAELRRRLAELPPAAAAAKVAAATGLPRREVYRRALALRRDPQ